MKDDSKKVPDEKKMTLHTKLKELRKSKRFKQWQMADYLGISRQHYSSTERGDYDLTLRHILKLSSFYGVSIDYLLGLSAWKGKPPFERTETEIQIIQMLHEIDNPNVTNNILEILNNIKNTNAEFNDNPKDE